MLPSSLTVVFLILVNFIPLFGVLFLGWGLFPIMVLYWLENGIVGLLNLPKIALARAPVGGLPVALGMFGRGTLMVFFAFHYGLFWAIHGLFVFLLFGGPNPFSGNVDPFSTELPAWWTLAAVSLS